MDSIEKAKDLFAEGFTCSQSILGAFAPRLGLDGDLALKIAGPFGAGMARRGDTCGAVNGALMVIGLAKGSVAASDEDSKKNAYQLAGKFLDLFRSYNGSTVCRELLGCDVSNSEELQSARDQGLFRTRCADYLKDSAQILEDLLGQE